MMESKMQNKLGQSAFFEKLMDNDIMEVDDNFANISDENEETEEVEIVEEVEKNIEDPDKEVVMLEFDDPGQETLVFTLPEVPGAPDAEVIVFDESNDEDIDVEEEKDVEVEVDPWDWQAGGLENYLPWLHGMMNNPPQHTGYDTTGLEKCISYFQFLEKTVPKAMRMDIKNVIDSRKAEEAREQIYDAISRLSERLEQVTHKKYKTKKKSWAESTGIIKEAQRSPRITGITITVPLIISRCARACINGTISAGHDLEELYQHQVEEYGLNKIQQAELSQLLMDMGYPIRQDRGFAPGTHIDTTRSDNVDFAANYQG